MALVSSTIFTRWNCLSTFRSALNRGRFCASPGVSGAILVVLAFRKAVDGFTRRKPFSAPKCPSRSLFLQKLWTTTIRPQLEKTRKLLPFSRVDFRVRKRELGKEKHDSKRSLPLGSEPVGSRPCQMVRLRREEPFCRGIEMSSLRVGVGLMRRSLPVRRFCPVPLVVLSGPSGRSRLC